MTYNEYFDAIYCINLDRRPAKWERCHRLFKKHGLKVRRIRAVDGGQMDAINRYKGTTKARENLPSKLTHAPKLTQRSTACSLSHCNAIMDARRRNRKRILIFEDDILFHMEHAALFDQLVAILPEQWGLLYLGASQYAWNHLKWVNPHLYRADTTYGRFAYGIDSSVFDLLVRTWTRFETTGDGYLAHALQRQIAGCYVAFPNLMIADVTTSDLRPGRSQSEQAFKLRWNLRDYEM